MELLVTAVVSISFGSVPQNRSSRQDGILHIFPTTTTSYYCCRCCCCYSYQYYHYHCYYCCYCYYHYYHYYHHHNHHHSGLADARVVTSQCNVYVTYMSPS